MQTVTYHFRFPDGRKLTLSSEDPVPANPPAWTRLEHHQCHNCPLHPSTTPRCPMAMRLVPLIEKLGSLTSHDDVLVQVETPERSMNKVTTVQRAVGSLMGLLSAASGCPRTKFLQPMAHFHLPFSSQQESIFRVTSTYLLGQYFIQQQGGLPDWDLEGLKAHYKHLQPVNSAMAARLRSAVDNDGAVNALILLDLLAKTVPYMIDEALEEVKHVF